MPSGQNSHSSWSFFAALITATFCLNWLWEMVQMPAYVEMVGRSWAETILPCTIAALGDVAMTLAIYCLGALAARNWRWGVEGRWNVYLTGALLGGIFAAAYEWKSL